MSMTTSFTIPRIAERKAKEQYDPSERITGNNFDIGAYEQLGTAEKNEMFLEMGQAIKAWLHQLHGLL